MADTSFSAIIFVTKHPYFFVCSGWVVLGKPRPDSAKAYAEAGFQGHLTKVQIWSRALDITNEIQKQVCCS